MDTYNFPMFDETDDSSISEKEQNRKLKKLEKERKRILIRKNQKVLEKYKTNKKKQTPRHKFKDCDILNLNY